jgi:hypothetical protein
MESKTCFKSKNLSTSIMYLSVVTCNSIRISFLIAAFNDIDILGADTGNTYAPTKERVHSTVSEDFGLRASELV